jgi:hypothetical protein
MAEKGLLRYYPLNIQDGQTELGEVTQKKVAAPGKKFATLCDVNLLTPNAL